MIHTQIANGVEGVVVGGTTSEGRLMTWDEHIMLIARTITFFGSSLKVIGCTGSNSTTEAICATEQGFAVAMDAFLQVNPYYGKTSMTGQDIPLPVIYSIAGNPNMVGVKECSGIHRIQDYAANGLAIWSGNDRDCHDDGWTSGAAEVISVAANLIPGLMHKLMFENVNLSLNTKLMRLFDWLFVEPNPTGLNTALAQHSIARPIFRLPDVPLPIEKRTSFVQIVEEIGRLNFVVEKDMDVLEDDDFILLPRY
ncbi:hypothetical protein KSP39_PZI008510 [Platanthera zijinensis]|uniref:4-hydroxy-tetrahydrodipicolinate synthase n=1 Tax=Platanthera zijinensis TaxID=2320716 RepID=A0AAP0BNF9_9ASPA